MDPLLDWLLSASFGREKLALLVLCQAGIYALSSQLVWRMRCAGAGQGFLVSLGRSWFGRWMGQVARLVYFVGVPLAVLWRDAPSGDVYREMGIPTTYVGGGDANQVLLLLGLGEAEALRQLSAGVAIGGASLVLLLVLWVWYVRAVLARPEFQPSGTLRAVPWWNALQEALYAQLLWALYRGAAATWIVDRTMAAFVGLVLAVFPWVLDPGRRRSLFSLRGHLVVQDWLFALLTAFLSLSVRAIWFLVLMHTCWMWLTGRMLAHLSRPYAFRAASTPGQI
jgi:hypothetical protein